MKNTNQLVIVMTNKRNREQIAIPLLNVEIAKGFTFNDFIENYNALVEKCEKQEQQIKSLENKCEALKNYVENINKSISARIFNLENTVKELGGKL